MALGFYFHALRVHSREIRRGDQQAGRGRRGAPAGRSYHVALETDGEIQVFDIWESQEAFEAFADAVPILSGLGVEPGEPMAAQVRNVIPAEARFS